MTVTVRAKESGKSWVYKNVQDVRQFDGLEEPHLVLQMVATLDTPRCSIYFSAKNYYIDSIIVA